MDDFTFFDLVQAYKDCRKNKRFTNNALKFEFNLEENLINLYNDLKNNTYEIGESICFVVLHPKPREVWAASFRDRIVHHLVYNAIQDRFIKRFIVDTYSCIPKRGTLYATKKLARYAQSITNNYTEDAYYLKADLKNFFISIDKNILFELLCKNISEKWILDLVKQIVFNDIKANCFVKKKYKFKFLPKHKTLWNTHDSKGLPIGNLTSQFFSNVYLNSLDQYIKHVLKCKYYVRYVDDFVILHKNPAQLNLYHKRLTNLLKEDLFIDLHQNKKAVNKISRGIDFVGYNIKPNRIYLRQNVIRIIFKTSRQKKYWIINYQQVFENYNRKFVSTMNSYLGLLSKIKSFNIRKKNCLNSVNLFISCDKDFLKLITY